MREDRFGSYSIENTLAAIFNLFLLKSMMRYLLLCPPPLNRVVILPKLFLPPDFFSGAVKDFSGVVFVISSNDETLLNLVPGVTGLYFLNAIIILYQPSLNLFKQIDFIAGFQSNNRFLKMRRFA